MKIDLTKRQWQVVINSLATVAEIPESESSVLLRVISGITSLKPNEKMITHFQIEIHREIDEKYDEALREDQEQ